MVSANPTQKIATLIPGPMLAGVTALVLSPPTGDATPQTHAFASLTG